MVTSFANAVDEGIETVGEGEGLAAVGVPTVADGQGC